MLYQPPSITYVILSTFHDTIRIAASRCWESAPHTVFYESSPRLSTSFWSELAIEPASGLSSGSLASISFRSETAAENLESIRPKSGLNESQTDSILLRPAQVGACGNIV